MKRPNDWLKLKWGKFEGEASGALAILALVMVVAIIMAPWLFGGG